MANPHEEIAVRPAQPDDANAVAEIYNHYIRTTIVTFEEEPITGAEMARRIGEVQSASLPWLIAEQRNQVAGYAYATRWKPRIAYRFSVEITVYLAPEHAGRGIGSMLYGQLFSILQAQHVHAVIGGIALPNDASVALHQKFGLGKVAHFHEVGFKFNRWIDVGYWQKTL